MTKLPTQAEIDSRPIFDPQPGTIHVKKLVDIPELKQNRISDYVMGMLWLGNKAGHFTKREGDIWETPFIRGMKERKAHGHHGHPFLGPDGKVVELHGRLLHGGQDAQLVSRSPLRTYEEIISHPNYSAWEKEFLFAGGDADSYVRSNPRSPNTTKNGTTLSRPSDDKADETIKKMERYYTPSEAREVHESLMRHGGSNSAGGRKVKLDACFSHCFEKKFKSESDSDNEYGSSVGSKDGPPSRKQSKTVKQEGQQ